MPQTNPTIYSFRLASSDLEQFRNNARNGISPNKTATADVLRKFIKVYNFRPKQAETWLINHLHEMERRNLL